MTTKELAKYIEKNLKSPQTATIDLETGLAALRKIAKVAHKENVTWALLGGIAMQIYGGPRQTRDVDVLAAKTLSLESERTLSFGGERYRARVGEKDVAIDWIVRSDFAKAFYRKALEDAVRVANVPIVTPEWLVILKYMAGRFKDQEDGVFLLKQKGLVDRKLLRKKIIDTAGGPVWATMANHLRRWYDLADGKITTEKEDYEADRL